MSRFSPYMTGSFCGGAVGGIVAALFFFARRPEQYVKPTEYYLLMAVASGLLFLAATSIRNRKHLWLIIGVACIIGLTHIWTENLMFPGSLIGIDPWYHQMVVTHGLDLVGKDPLWPDLGITTIGGSYSLAHLWLRWVMELTGLSYKWASLIFTGSLQLAGSVILVGLVGKELLNRRVGAVAAIVLASANWMLFFGEWIIPNSVGVMLSLLAAYLIVKRHRPTWFKDWLLGVALLGILALAYAIHLIVAAWVIGIVLCLIGVRIAEARRRLDMAAPVLVAALVILSLPLWLTQTTMGTALNDSRIASGFSPGAASTTNAPVEITPPGIQSSSGPVTTQGLIAVMATHNELGRLSWELLLAGSGMALFIGGGVVGMIGLVRRRESTWAVRLWILLGAGVLFVGFMIPLFGIAVIPHRWWFLAETLLAIPLGWLLLKMAGQKHWVLPYVVAIGVGGLALLSTLGLPANMTNRSLAPDLTVRYAFTEKEIQGIEAAMGMSAKVIGSDSVMLQYVWSKEYGRPTEIVDKAIVSGDYGSIKADLLVLRGELTHGPFGFGGGAIYVLDYDPEVLAIQQGYDKVWSNGEISILRRQR